ncbi:hypothetical protein AGOR_G00064210 [Albula goreensis]|uniref:Coagulation factor VII n=1 Tax=Albula goreensis TaxID=1534307 RepID=A0A8T3DV16_9TELE|nr:hypothetical protein AGOR_G00064210 [Albula goreensis]
MRVMESNTQRAMFHYLPLFLCWMSVCLGIQGATVFLSRPEASGVLKHRIRRANSFFEELRLPDLERECLEETCSYEEAKEIFSVHENLNEFWRTYAEEDECKSSPCLNGAICLDQPKSYTCVCPSGYEGKSCGIVQGAINCLFRNGECEHFCTEGPGSLRQCACAPGYSLGEDDSSCLPQVPFSCGRVVEHAGPRIVRGSICPKGECPWQAMLELRETYICGGIILDTLWVLTAAHCVWEVPASYLQVTVGEHIRLTPEGTEQVKKVVQVVPHPSYNKTTSDGDIALLKLDSRIELGPYARPVCLPPNNKVFILHTLALVRNSVVSGWGKLAQSGPDSLVLQRLEVPRVPLQTCRAQTNLTITNNMLCAGFLKGGQDSCQGDSGGPLVTRYKNTWFLTGVVSWGKGCAQSGSYGIYTRVSNYLAWISSIMATA